MSAISSIIPTASQSTETEIFVHQKLINQCPRRIPKLDARGQPIRSFPARDDYEHHFVTQGWVQNAAELWSNDNAVARIQRHWHTTGQNGCVFAQMISRVAAAAAWQHVVVRPELDDESVNAIVKQISLAIDSAIASPTCEILSILLPLTITPEQLAKAISLLLKVPHIFLAREVAYEELTTVALRITLANADKQPLSWLMGFGPFAFFPKTRSSPVTEVAIRVKPKPEGIFHRLNQDTSAAHLADFSLELNDATTERMWQATLRNTGMVLGHHSDHFSAAKVTFSIPHALWNECRTPIREASDAVESDYPS